MKNYVSDGKTVTWTNGTTAWHLFSDPAFGAAIQYGYLEGDSATRITTNEPFNQNGSASTSMPKLWTTGSPTGTTAHSRPEVE